MTRPHAVRRIQIVIVTKRLLHRDATAVYIAFSYLFHF